MTLRHIAAIAMSAAAIHCGAADNHLLRADGITDTYRLIAQAGYYTETSATQTPDQFMGHGDYRHILQVYDATLGGYVFAFDIHIDCDGITDGDKGALIDRQRNEIKCMSAQPDMVAADGETLTYRWKFRLPEGMLTTSEFCHIHQIKGMGSGEEVAHPVFTFTCRNSGSRQVLQIINVPYEGARNVNLAQTDLAPLLGRWIQATETFTVGHNGSYTLTLTDIADGTQILYVDKKDIEVWRNTDDSSTMRGKWGIYRSLGADLNLKGSLRSERVLFADFEAIKGPENAAVYEMEISDDTEDGPIYDLAGRRAYAESKGFLIKNRKLIKQ